MLGFALVFVATGALFGTLGKLLLTQARPLTIVLGVVLILVGLIFAGLIPLGQRDLRIHRLPRSGRRRAPVGHPVRPGLDPRASGRPCRWC